ncbi:MAG: TonB-dependent receptor [Candidatus Aminicenantes bacterium]|nr:TonB-dependent receptor [Candidatus Aminicenantes bacterium]
MSKSSIYFGENAMQHLIASLLLVFLSFSSLLSDENKDNPLIEEKIEVIGKVPLYRALQSISVFDEEHLKNFSPDELKGLLNQSPGMLVLNAGNPAQFSYSFARGASVNQMLYLVDGVKLHDPSSSLAGNYSFLSPQLIEKVEIVRGPLSNLYGSSAMGGVINIITRKKEGLILSLAGGSHGTLESSIQFGERFSDFFVFLNSNFLNYDDSLKNDHFERKGFSFNSGYEKDRFSLGISLFGNIVNAGIPEYLGEPTPDRKYTQSNLLFTLPVKFNITNESYFDIKGSLHWNNYEFSDPDDLWNYLFSNSSFVTELQTKFSTKFLAKFALSAGWDFSRQKIDNFDNNEKIISGLKTDVNSLYLDMNIDFSKLLVAGSVRYDKYSGLSGVFSPQIGVSLNVNSNLKLRSSFSQSFRAPTIPEMLNPYWGNANLLPETGKSFEIGCDLFLSRINMGLSFFNSEYSNLIGFSPLTAKFANINKAKIAGVEINCNWKIVKGLNWLTAYTYLHSQDIQYKRALLRRPRHSFSAALHHHTSRFTLSAEMVYVGKRLDYDELFWTVSENTAFSHFNFSVTIPIFKKISGFFRVSNALNSHFEEVLGYAAPLRRVLFGVKYQVKN